MSQHIFKDIIPSILQTKIPLEDEKDYIPFLVNRALSQHYDCVLRANEMNMLPHTPKRMQFDYLSNSIRAYKRPFQKWHKRIESEDLEAVKEYYKYSNEKAKAALSILTESQLNEIKKQINKGGSNNDKHTRRSDLDNTGPT